MTGLTGREHVERRAYTGGVASVAYRVLLVAAAAGLLWVQSWDQAGRLLPWPLLLPEPPVEQQQLLVLALVTCGAALLTLNFEGRQNVSLLVLPVGLAWWQLGGQAAALVAGFGALFGNASRRGPALGSVSGAARLLLATEVGAAAASLARISDAGNDGPAGILTAAALVQAAAFTVGLSVTDLALDWSDRRLHPAGRAGSDPQARTDLPFNLLLFPLLVLFQAIYLALGYERQGIMLGGLLAVLLVVRTYTNLRTLHGTLRRLHDAVSEEREKLDTLITHSGEAIFTVDPELRVSTVNPALVELLGLPQDAVIGLACADVCHFEDEQGARLCPDRCPLVAAQRQRSPVSMDVIYQAPDQPPKNVLLTYAAVTTWTGKLRLGIGIARNITAQKEAERLREDFVSLVTHDLRSPLTSSMGYLDLLKRLLARAPVSVGLDLQKAVEYVERIQGAERHVLRLVNNLLDMARVERGEIPDELGEVRLDTLIGEVVDGIMPQATQKSISVTVQVADALPSLWTSELYAREILSNLVSNAVKYTPEEGGVTVRASAPPGAQSVQVDVQDTGYGMAPDELDRLFGKFFRSGRPEIRKERGTGLGLALSKQMAAQLGGDITVISTLGEGSTFTLRLPVTQPPEQSGAPDRVTVASQ